MGSYGPVWVRPGRSVPWTAGAYEPFTITAFGDTVYYGDSAVSSSHYTGTLTSGQQVQIQAPTWFAVSSTPHADGNPHSARLEASDAPSRIALESSGAKVLHVSGVGDDGNDGLSWGRALATVDRAVVAARSAGGGHIMIGPGTFPLTTGTLGNPFLWACSNLTVKGTPGLTTLKPTGADGRVIIGFDAYSEAGNQYENFHLSDLTFDFSDQVTNAALMVCACRDWTIRRVVIIGGQYMLSLGGDVLPAQRGRVEKVKLIVDPDMAGQAIAVTNVEDVVIDQWEVVGPGATDANIGILDCETNLNTDSLRGLSFTNGRVRDMAQASITIGAVTDPDRCSGVEFSNNVLVDCGGLNVNVPRAVVKNNKWLWTKRSYFVGHIPNGAITVGRNTSYGIPVEGCVVADNVIQNMCQSTSAIMLEGSHCVVKGNQITDTHGQVVTKYSVAEVQTQPCVLSGGVVTVTTGLGLAVAAMVFQEANAGATHNITATTFTLDAASVYDRVDTVVADSVSGALRVVKGTQAAFGLKPASGVESGDNAVPVAQIYVQANASSLAANDVLDVRPFPPNHNVIEQQTSHTPLQFGQVRLRGSGSRRIVPRRPVVTDAYMLSVLADNPLLYLPLTETDGRVAHDFSGNGWDGNYIGGVLLNQQVGATSRYGAKFDGTTGYVQVTRPDVLVRRALAVGAFTLETQVLLADTTLRILMTQGFGSGADFAWGTRNDPHLMAKIGNSSSAPGANWSEGTTVLSTSVIAHLAADWDGSNLKFYVNGSLDTVGTLTPGTPTYTFTDDSYSNWPIWIGAGNGSGSLPADAAFFKGIMRHAAIYAPNIGATRIAAHAALM